MSSSILITFFIPVFLASLLGSLHCVGMCGGFVMCYAAKSTKRPTAHLAYHSGRLLSYIFLGALAGVLGSMVNTIGLSVNIQYFAAIMVSILLTLWGIEMLFGVRLLSQIKLPWLGKLNIFSPYASVLNEKLDFSWQQRAFLLGSLSGFLPCGWLWAFIAVAAASGSALLGMFVMFAFWLGTVPALLTLAELSQPLVKRLGSSVPKLQGLLLIIAAASSLFLHSQLLASPLNQSDHSEPSSCHAAP